MNRFFTAYRGVLNCQVALWLVKRRDTDIVVTIHLAMLSAELWVVSCVIITWLDINVTTKIDYSR